MRGWSVCGTCVRTGRRSGSVGRPLRRRVWRAWWRRWGLDVVVGGRCWCSSSSLRGCWSTGRDRLRWTCTFRSCSSGSTRGANPAFRRVRDSRSGDHGWIEPVAPVGCESSEARTRFHERVGGLMALLHVLEAAGLSSAHVVAHGEHPVLVDAELLFQSRARHRGEGGEHSEGGSAVRLAAEGLAQSLLRVGLLPRSWLGVEPMMFAEQLAPPGDVPAIERGFARMYRLLCAVRPELLMSDGPFWRFATDRVRVRLRPLAMYQGMLLEGTSPEVLRDGVERERLFDRLWEDVDEEPELARVIQAEREDLERGDVPCFRTMPSSHALWTSIGVELPRFFDRSGTRTSRIPSSSACRRRPRSTTLVASGCSAVSSRLECVCWR